VDTCAGEDRFRRLPIKRRPGFGPPAPSATHGRRLVDNSATLGRSAGSTAVAAARILSIASQASARSRISGQSHFESRMLRRLPD
jgi:hypothetical protein